MKKKIAAALVGLLILTVMLTWPLYTKPALAQGGSETHLYWGISGVQNSSSELGGEGAIGRFGYSGPSESYNITFSEPWFHAGGGWMVNLTVPHQTFVTSPGYDYEFIGWVRNNVTMNVDGYGWLFLNATGDVDCYTSNNVTGSYWIDPSPMAGTKAAEPNTHPSTGADGVPGTADDGFGDGTLDPAGSSILYLKTNTVAHYASEATSWTWQLMFSYDWIGVWTTGVAYDIVTQSGSLLNGVWHRQEGDPWEFLAGKDHLGMGPVPHGHPKWNAYVIYAASWSQIDVDTMLGKLDLLVSETNKLVREDCVIADITCDEKVSITDIVIAALAFGAQRAGLGPDGLPGTPDDILYSDPNWDPRGDFAVAFGKITITDIVTIALDFGNSLTPDCIIST